MSKDELEAIETELHAQISSLSESVAKKIDDLASFTSDRIHSIDVSLVQHAVLQKESLSTLISEFKRYVDAHIAETSFSNQRKEDMINASYSAILEKQIRLTTLIDNLTKKVNSLEEDIKSHMHE